MTGWQPIETAPKDGRVIMVFAGEKKPDDDQFYPELMHLVYWAIKMKAWWMVEEPCFRCFDTPNFWRPIPREKVSQLVGEILLGTEVTR